MKKRLFVFTSLIAFALSICLFVFSVFAVGHDFSINNKIVFEGTSEYLVFDVNAQITGTTIDGRDSLKTSWKYDKSDENYSNPMFEWNVPEVLTFNTDGIPISEVAIVYTFEIINKSVGNRAISVYIDEPVNFDNDAMTYHIDATQSNKRIILASASSVVTLELKPNNGEFSGEREIKFNLIIEEAY